MEYMLIDIEDGTCHYGDGDWGSDRTRAERYPNAKAARAALDDVDQDHLLRHRLKVVTAQS